MSNAQVATKSQQCFHMPRLLFCVWVVLQFCASQLEERQDSQKDALSGRSSTRPPSPRWRERERESVPGKY
uniref:Secreted protein n=1 Tax=Arion vulgaris TaxID=1028688 RepID=A0A0B6YUA5_9EUPU